MRTKRISYALALPLIALISFSCSKDMTGSLSGETCYSKISNAPVNVSQESIILLLAQGTDPAAVMESLPEIRSIKRVFSSSKGQEKLEQSFRLDRWYEAEIADGCDIESAAKAAAKLEAVEIVEYNSFSIKASDGKSYPYFPEPATKADGAIFNDPSLKDQWHYINTGDKSVATTAYAGADINVKDAWELVKGDPSIIIAVVDEAVKYTHPDLAENMWINTGEIPGNGKDDDGNGYVDDVHGWNFRSNGPIDWTKEGNTGHGTHIAGTIAAVNNNGIGVVGIAGGSGNGDGVKIMSCQVHNGSEMGSASHSAEAIKYAADNGASIIQCSWGYPIRFASDTEYRNMFPLEYDAIKYFERKKNNDILDGGIAIFASGNDGNDFASYPGAYSDLICVSAFGPDYLPTYYTNYGPGCNIIAPGGEVALPPFTSFKALILSTLCSETSEDNSDYGYMQGTSMACPHVTGIAALGLAYAKKLGKKFTVKEFKDMIVTSANEFESRLDGTKEYAMYSPTGPTAPLDLSKYRKQMGSGSIDTWRLLMKIEGVPCLNAEIGKNQWLDISDFFGTSSVNLTFLGNELSNGGVSVEISDAGKASLGLEEEPYIKYGRLYVHPTKAGSAKITVRAIAGGDQIGGDTSVGGMEVTQEISVISRSVKASNGGWL